MQAWYGDTGLLFYNNRDTLNPFLTVRTADSTGAFFDDQWSIRQAPDRQSRAALRPHDHEVRRREGLRASSSAAEDINGPPPSLRDREATDNIYDFKTWGPRLGLSYMLTEDGKTVARASYGRYYQPISVETLRRFGPDMPAACNGRLSSSGSGPWSSVDTNGDGEIDTLETRNAARRIHGLTPISVETETNDPSWTLNVADDLKNQYTDQLTLNFQREVARNLSFSASYIYKRAGNLFSNIPINEVTGQPWEYERIPFTTAAGRQVELYSVVFRDYNGDGVLERSRRRRGSATTTPLASRTCRSSMASSPSASSRRCSSSSTSGTPTDGRASRRRCFRTRTASADARSGRTSTSKRRCSTTTTGWGTSTTRSTTWTDRCRSRRNSS